MTRQGSGSRRATACGSATSAARSLLHAEVPRGPAAGRRWWWRASGRTRRSRRGIGINAADQRRPRPAERRRCLPRHRRLAAARARARVGLPPPAGADRGVIDLYSDTRTRPTAGMRRAIAEAEVGDEQAMLDPTVNRLCERVADLLGKEAAVYLPSGTMCNQIAARVHCRQGDEIILSATAHPLHAESGGPAALAGVMLRGLQGERGMFSAEQVRAAINAPDWRHAPRSRLLEVENTTNHGGGAVWPIAQIRAVTAVAREHGLACHMDGARLMNAVVASGIAGGRLRRAVRFGLARFLQGPGRAGRRRARRLQSLRARGLAGQAADRRRHAPGRDHRRGLYLRPRPPRRAPGRRSRQREGRWPRAWPRSPASSSIRPPSRPTSCGSTCAGGCVPPSSRQRSRSRGS